MTTLYSEARESASTVMSIQSSVGTEEEEQIAVSGGSILCLDQ
jgi:hypothetical protein